MKLGYMAAVVIASTALVACEVSLLDENGDDSGKTISIQQGIAGEVREWRGDFMPGPGRPSGTIKGVSRMVYVFPLTNRRSATEPFPPNGFYSSLGKTPIDSVQSRSDGFFQIALAPGRYTLVIRENGQFYANGWDGDGDIYPVNVTSGAVTQLKFDITYQATF